MGHRIKPKQTQSFYQCRTRERRSIPTKNLSGGGVDSEARQARLLSWSRWRPSGYTWCCSPRTPGGEKAFGRTRSVVCIRSTTKKTEGTALRGRAAKPDTYVCLRVGVNFTTTLLCVCMHTCVHLFHIQEERGEIRDSKEGPISRREKDGSRQGCQRSKNKRQTTGRRHDVCSSFQATLTVLLSQGHMHLIQQQPVRTHRSHDMGPQNLSSIHMPPAGAPWGGCTWCLGYFPIHEKEGGSRSEGRRVMSKNRRSFIRLYVTIIAPGRKSYC